jgi:DMSO/TMAO reductase YedYZ heme-binding membrane subunit
MTNSSRHLSLAKIVVHGLALTPLAALFWQARAVARTGSNALGADPVAEIEHRLGIWALRFLLITLAVSPLRQLTGHAVLIRFRRMFGLYAFAYATLHFAAYLLLDLRGFGLQVSRTSPSGPTSPSVSPLGCCWCRSRSLRPRAGCAASADAGDCCTRRCMRSL